MSVGAIRLETVLETIVDGSAIERDAESAKDVQFGLGADRVSSV